MYKVWNGKSNYFKVNVIQNTYNSTILADTHNIHTSGHRGVG